MNQKIIGRTVNEPCTAQIHLGNTINGLNTPVYLSVDRPLNIAVIAPSGSGKTMLASLICEGLALPGKNHIKNFNYTYPISILDLLGNMHGIKNITSNNQEEYSAEEMSNNIDLNYIPTFITDEGENFEEKKGFKKLTLNFSKLTESNIHLLMGVNSSKDTNMVELIKKVWCKNPKSPGEFYNYLLELDDKIETKAYEDAWVKLVDRAEKFVKYEIFNWDEEDVIRTLKQRKTVIVNCEKSLMDASEITNLWIKLHLDNLKTERRRANELEKTCLYEGKKIDLSGCLPNFWLVADEIHRLNKDTLESFGDFVRTARNWNCSTLMSTQCVDDIDKDIRKNLSIVFLGRMSEREAIKMLKDFPLQSNAKKLITTIKDLLPGQFLVLDKLSGNLFFLNTRERITWHFGETNSTSALLGLYQNGENCAENVV